MAPRIKHSPTTASVTPTPMPVLTPGAIPLVLGALVDSKLVNDVDNKLGDGGISDRLVKGSISDRLVDGVVNDKLADGDVVDAKI